MASKPLVAISKTSILRETPALKTLSSVRGAHAPQGLVVAAPQEVCSEGSSGDTCKQPPVTVKLVDVMFSRRWM
jgi:hypothetical protein